MADYDLVRDILDEQLVDAAGRAIGKVDGIVMELRDDAPPRLLAMEVGLPVLGYRLHPTLGRLLERVNRWMRLPGNGCARLPFHEMEVRKTEIVLPVGADTTGALAWEHWLRRHLVGRLPGGRGRANRRKN